MSERTTTTIPQPPTTFDLQPFAGRWFQWAEIKACFWPGRGRRAEQINPTLCPVRHVGGVYLMAWSQDAPRTSRPDDPSVQYVGETGDFQRRMGQFGSSAGFWKGVREKGHSAGYRWPLGKSEHLWVGYFTVDRHLRPHIAEGMRCWMEAVAQEEYRLAQGDVPPLNRRGTGEIPLEDFGAGS